MGRIFTEDPFEIMIRRLKHSDFKWLVYIQIYNGKLQFKLKSFDLGFLNKKPTQFRFRVMLILCPNLSHPELLNHVAFDRSLLFLKQSHFFLSSSSSLFAVFKASLVSTAFHQCVSFSVLTPTQVMIIMFQSLENYAQIIN